MAFCTKCGKQNPDAARFCTACGNPLSASIQPQQPAIPVSDQHAQPRKNNSTLWLVVIIVTLALGVAAYFIFFNDNKNKRQDKVASITTQDTAVAGTTPQMDTAAVAPPTVNMGNENTVRSLSEGNTDIAMQTLKNFYQCENNEDVSCLLNHYRFPVERYYQLNYVKYEDLHKLFTESFSDKLSYHYINIKWDYATVVQEADGYKAVLYADYEFRRARTPDELMTRSIQIIIQMDGNYLIKSIYENQ